jgi:hypothetical protein
VQVVECGSVNGGLAVDNGRMPRICCRDPPLVEECAKAGFQQHASSRASPGELSRFRDRRKATREPFMFAEVIASVPWCRTTRMRLARPRRSVIGRSGGAGRHRSDCAAFDRQSW